MNPYPIFQESNPSNNMSFTYYKTKPIKSNPKKAVKPAQRSNAMQLYVAPRQQARVRRAMPQEVNYVDLAAATYGLNTTGSITLLATIAQGATVNQRIGKRAYYKSLLLRGSCYSNANTTIADGGFLVVYDKRPTGALPAITDILTSISPNAFMNDNNTGRFEVIRRFDYVFAGNSTTPTTGLEVHNIDEFIKLGKRPITFEALGTGAINDIDMGALYLVTYGSVAAGTGASSLYIAARVRFTEQ